MTIPLSSTRSRTSIKLDPPDTRSTAISSSRRSVQFVSLYRPAESPYFPRLLPYLFFFLRPLADCARLRRTLSVRKSAEPNGTAPGGRPCTSRGARLPTVRFGSCFHQFSPICSALSTEQTSRRMRMVSSSTFAKEMRTSPATTSPLSRTRSRMSIRLVVPATVGTRSILRVPARQRSSWIVAAVAPGNHCVTAS